MSERSDRDEDAGRARDRNSGSAASDGDTDSGAAGRERPADVPVRARVGRLLLPGPIRRRSALKFALAMVVVIALVAAVGVGSYLQIRDITDDAAWENPAVFAVVELGE